jgi:hypothetical protein
MDAYHVVLYVHICSLLLAIAAAGALVTCLFGLRASRTLAEAAPWGMTAGKVGRLFPVAILGLFGSGAYMTSHFWSWSTGWIVAGIVGLVVLAVQGPGVGERTGKQLEHALKANGPGDLGADARRMCLHPGLWVTEFSAIGLVLGIVWNMTEKPGTWGAVAAEVIGYAVGAAVALAVTRSNATATSAAADAV